MAVAEVKHESPSRPEEHLEYIVREAVDEHSSVTDAVEYAESKLQEMPTLIKVLSRKFRREALRQRIHSERGKRRQAVKNGSAEGEPGGTSAPHPQRTNKSVRRYDSDVADQMDQLWCEWTIGDGLLRDADYATLEAEKNDHGQKKVGHARVEAFYDRLMQRMDPEMKVREAWTAPEVRQQWNAVRSQYAQ